MTQYARISQVSDEQAAASWDHESDELAFDEVIREHRDVIESVVFRLMAWPTDRAHVDDLVQEIFLKAWMNRKRFRGDCQLRTWLTRIAINEVRNHARRQVLWRQTFGRLTQRFTDSEKRVSSDETQERVQKAIRRLKPKERELIVLRYIEEQTPAEIATLLGLKRNTLDARLSRARRKLEVLLEVDETNS